MVEVICDTYVEELTYIKDIMTFLIILRHDVDRTVDFFSLPCMLIHYSDEVTNAKIENVWKLPITD